jgi:hypothetical protein
MRLLENEVRLPNLRRCLAATHRKGTGRRFFEANQWILGHGLHYVADLDARRSVWVTIRGDMP